MRTFVVLSAVLLVPASSFAQQASIAGVVKDASGAVLPGVSVEATSSVLTEKVRAVVTDGTGQYRIVELPPGTYSLTFTLQGFNVVKREGVMLAGSLTAAIDVELRVGELQETVTVTGESPIVDVQSARRQQVIDGDVLNAIPTSRSYNNVLQLVPGVVAGDGQVQLRPTMLLFTAHGGSTEDGRLTLDGINTGASRGGAGVSGYIPDMQNAAEVTFTISGNLGEAETGGPQMTVVPRSGGNTFNGSFFISGLNDSMQGDNFDAAQLSVLSAPAKSLLLRDYQVSVGGPVIRDRMWFFFNHRRIDSADAQPGIFANKNAGDPTKFTYVPDFTRQGRIDQSRKIYSLRLTTQISPRNKLMLFWDEQPQCSGAAWPGTEDNGCMSNKDGWIYGGSQVNGFFGGGPNSPETGDYASTHQKVQQVKYTAPTTNKLLLEAGFGTYISQWGYTERPGNP
ncbi:MAG TPA: carboxypeptidase-like regulatory domain-containing protein, partial [Vicinamibacterales bacterium]|nr:carboxypeptidase-like regulatory domain-containing protein [Vicinamibacterales bacterium]